MQKIIAYHTLQTQIKSMLCDYVQKLLSNLRDAQSLLETCIDYHKVSRTHEHEMFIVSIAMSIWCINFHNDATQI